MSRLLGSKFGDLNRQRAGQSPPSVRPLALAATVTVAGTATASALALASLYAYLFPDSTHWLATALFAVLWLVAWVPIVPAVQALGKAQKTGRLLRADDIVGARHHAARRAAPRAELAARGRDPREHVAHALLTPSGDGRSHNCLRKYQ